MATATREGGSGPEPADEDVVRERDWEALLADGKLYRFCYLRDGVIALAPSDCTGTFA